ncbi:MAG: major capsid protein V20 domain-containing protein, partial [Candidatus Fonsibacter sp.]
MCWDEFCGSMMSCCGASVPNRQTAVTRSPYSGVGANLAGAEPNPGVQYVPTTGIILVLNFAEVIQLTEEYYAPGSLGTFNLQLSVQAQNNQNEDWPTNGYELVIMRLNSGVCVNERGTSSTFLSLLTKHNALDALQQQPYSKVEVQRVVGGGFLDSIRSATGWIHNKLPAVRGGLEHVPHQYAQTGAKVLKALGYGKGQRPMDPRLT